MKVTNFQNHKLLTISNLKKTFFQHVNFTMEFHGHFPIIPLLNFTVEKLGGTTYQCYIQICVIQMYRQQEKMSHFRKGLNIFKGRKVGNFLFHFSIAKA